MISYFSKVVQRYIVQYTPSTWPVNGSGSDTGGFLEPRKPFFIPEIGGVPEDCLPLMVIFWTNACSAQFLGLMANTEVLYANIAEPRESGQDKYSLCGLECYSDLNELFTTKLSQCSKVNTYTNQPYIADARAIYLVEFYREYDYRLRNRYPALESLFISAPMLSKELARLWSDFERAEAHS